MAAGYHDYTAGEVLTAANLEDFCQNQSIMRFANAAARDSALTTVKTEGMFAYLIDTNTVTVYTGSAWSTVGPVHGALLSFTPTITQSAGVAATINNSTYSRIGRQVTWRFTVSITGTGSAANVVTLTIPVAVNYGSSNVSIGGYAVLNDSSASQQFSGPLAFDSTTTVKIQHTGAAALAYLGASGFTAALASGDTIGGFLTYEAAADA